MQHGGWNRGTLGVLLVHSLLLQVVTYCLRPSLSYAALEAGLGSEWLGVLSAAFALPGLGLAIPAGRLADRIGERALGVAGGALMLGAAVTALLGHQSIVAILVATTAFGLGHLITVVCDQALLANRTEPARRDTVFGAYAFSVSLGQGVGGALLAVNAGIAATPDLRLQFVLSVVITALGLFAAVLLRSSPRHAPSERPRTVPVRNMLREPAVLRAVLASSVVVTAVEITLIYFPALGYELGYPAAVVSAMLVARAAAGMLSRVGLGAVIRVVGRRRLMVGSIAVSAVALTAVALPLGPVWTVGVCAMFGLLNGFCQPLTLSWLSEIAPSGQRGTLMSVRLASVRISQTAVPGGIGALGG
ncbi:MAG: MFS transporter, partial [Actinobacteria bacterium]|nr:MFS transporter [Actinomycetota bacterium]